VVPYIEKWIISIFIKNKRKIELGCLKEHSWECFIYCLKYYKADYIPLPSHFYTYINFYFKQQWSKEEKRSSKEVRMDEISTEMLTIGSPTLGMEQTIDIKNFKEFLPEEYGLVFDDALKSMSRNKRERIGKSENIKMSSYRYYEAKKVMKLVLCFFLRK
jgi:hypothetical protein